MHHRHMSDAESVFDPTWSKYLNRTLLNIQKQNQERTRQIIENSGVLDAQKRMIQKFMDQMQPSIVRANSMASEAMRPAAESITDRYVSQIAKSLAISAPPRDYLVDSVLQMQRNIQEGKVAREELENASRTVEIIGIDDEIEDEIENDPQILKLNPEAREQVRLAAHYVIARCFGLIIVMLQIADVIDAEQAEQRVEELGLEEIVARFREAAYQDDDPAAT